MFVGTQQQKMQKKPNTCKRKGQDTTKITSAPAESCIQFPWSVMPISMTWWETFLTEPPSRILQRRSMKQDLSDSTISFPRWWECCVCVWLFWTFCIVLRSLLLALCCHGDFNTALGRKFGQIVTRRRSSPWRFLLWTPSHSLDTPIDLDFRWGDHEARQGYWGAEKRRNRSKNHENEAMIPVTYSREVIRRRPLERTEHLTTHGNQLRMTMRGLRWDKVTCLQQYLNELPIREFEKTEQYRTSDRIRKRCTVPPPKTPTQWHGLTIAEVSCHNPWGKQAQTLISTTCRRISAASSWTTSVLSTRRVNFGKLRILISRFLQMKGSTLPTILTCRFLQNSGETTTRMWFWRQRLTACQQTHKSCFMTMA